MDAKIKGPPVASGEIYTIKIRGIAGDNEGVGNVEGFPVYIRGAGEGETVKIRIVKLHKYYAIGEKV